jgi:broad specificity phosphatase PhoE
MFVVLHGQTEWNAHGRVQGHLNSELTELGRQQAATVGRILRGRSVSGIVSSPLGRTLETARIVAVELGLDAQTIRQEDLLKEVFLGQWEGLTFAEIEARWPERLVGADRHDWYFRSPDGESYSDIAARLGAWLSSNVGQEDLVIVTHGIASRVLRGLYEKLSVKDALQLEIARDAVTHLDGGRALKLVEADASALRGGANP